MHACCDQNIFLSGGQRNNYSGQGGLVFLLCKLINKLKFSKGEAGPEFPFKSSYGDKIGHYGIGINQKNKKNFFL